jgi:hypothetical protein
MNKPVVVIYVQKDQKSTKVLTDFIANNIDRINHSLIIKLTTVNAGNAKAVKGSGIERTPTLVYDGKKFVTLEKIIQILTPPEITKDNFGYANTNPDDLVHQYQSTIMDAGDDGDDGDDQDTRGEVIRQKMVQMQKKRPQMDGVEGDRRLNGGRKITSKQPPKKQFSDDDEFRRATRVDNVDDTPMKEYTDDIDGSRMLEDYYNDEADKAGRLHTGKRSGRRRG